MGYDKEADRELVDVEIARYQESDFIYQLWKNNDDELEVNVVAETYLDGSNQEHVENIKIEGTMEELDNAYEWTPTGRNSEEKDITIVSYKDELEPERQEPENLNQVAELERALESGFNDKKFNH